MKEEYSAKLNIDKDEVLRYLGYNNQSVSPELERTIEHQIESCVRIATPGYLYTKYDVEHRESSVYLKGAGIELAGRDICHHLAGCRYCVMMALTCGMGVERELTRLQRVSMTDAVVFDACANTYAERLADYVQSLVEMDAKQEGLYINYRYSPGYGDFPLDMQRVIVPALGCEKRIGLTVTDSSLLIPHKSITAVIGIFDSKPDIERKSCKICNMYDTCILRKNGDTCDK